MAKKTDMLGPDEIRVDIGDRSYYPTSVKDGNEFSVVPIRDGLYSILHEGKSITAVVQTSGSHQLLFTVDHQQYVLDLVDHRLQLLEEYGMSDNQSDHERHVAAPMPGLVLKIEVKEGDRVKKNDPLLVLEAMKMENEIRAPGDGVVATIHVSAGKAVAKNDVLLDMSPEAGD